MKKIIPIILSIGSVFIALESASSTTFACNPHITAKVEGTSGCEQSDTITDISPIEDFNNEKFFGIDNWELLEKDDMWFNWMPPLTGNAIGWWGHWKISSDLHEEYDELALSFNGKDEGLITFKIAEGETKGKWYSPFSPDKVNYIALFGANEKQQPPSPRTEEIPEPSIVSGFILLSSIILGDKLTKRLL